MLLAKRKALADTGRGTVGKTAVVGVKDRDGGEVRAEVVERTEGASLKEFVREHVEPGAKLYADEAAAYKGLPEFDHEAVNHSIAEYVRGMAHTNGIESFWSMLKRAHDGTFHKMSPKHLQRYVSEFAGKHNHRNSDTLVQMRDTVARLVRRRLLRRNLIADNGLPSGSERRGTTRRNRARQLLGRRALQVHLRVEYGHAPGHDRSLPVLTGHPSAATLPLATTQAGTRSVGSPAEYNSP